MGYILFVTPFVEHCPFRNTKKHHTNIHVEVKQNELTPGSSDLP